MESRTYETSVNPAANSADQVEAHILSRLGSRVRYLRVLLRDNGLVLRGYTQTYYAKQLAQHAAAEITGLPIHANEIEVR